jgi:hypothetical protein
MERRSRQIYRLHKIAASVMELGDPAIAGRSLADIVRFLINRIDPNKRGKAVTNLRNKIWALDEYDISNKKTPATASLGQSITFIKTILIGHHPLYIRRVLEEVVRNLW